MNQQENREIRISPDALIALVVAEAEDRELSAMPSLEEMNAAFHPSEEFQKKMDRLLKQAKRKQERKGAWRATKRLFVVATTVVTAFACILMPVQAVQEAVVSTVLNWRDQFVEILYSKEDDPNAVILLQNVELTYLPEGFTETPSNRTSNTSFWNEYQSENGEWLTVRILPIQDKQSTFVDDEYTSSQQMLNMMASVISNNNPPILHTGAIQGTKRTSYNDTSKWPINISSGHFMSVSGYNLSNATIQVTDPDVTNQQSSSSYSSGKYYINSSVVYSTCDYFAA